MKYLFGASSHLVFYLCNRIVDLDSLNPDDCIFFFTRNYRCPEKYNAKYKNRICTDYNVDTTRGRIFAGLNVIKTYKNIKDFDALVDQYLHGDSFYWYSQICNNDLCSLMVTKKNCIGYYVLEDGLGSYRTSNPQTFTGIKYPLYKFVLKPLCPRCFEVKNHFIETNHPKFKGCIATTDFCFPLHKQYLRCVGLPFEKVDIGFEPDAVISVDPLYLYGIGVDDVNSVYEKISSFVKDKKYKTIAYKFHPYFFANVNAQKKNDYRDLLFAHFGDSIKEIPANMGLENVLMTYKSDFYTDNSSVAVYAHAMNVTCFTYMPLLQKYANITFDNVPLIGDFCLPVQCP